MFIALGIGDNVHAVLAAFMVLVWVVAIGLAASMQGENLKLRHWFSYRSRYARVLRPRSIALLLVSIVSFAFADVVMLLAGFLYAPDDAAVVGVAVRLAALGGFVLQAGQLFVLPDFTAALTRRDTVAANTVLWRNEQPHAHHCAFRARGGPAAGTLRAVVFRQPLRAGALLLVLFLVGQSIRSLGGMNQNLLAIGGFQIRTAMPCVLALAILVAGSIVLVPCSVSPGSAMPSSWQNWPGCWGLRPRPTASADAAPTCCGWPGTPNKSGASGW